MKTIADCLPARATLAAFATDANMPPLAVLVAVDGRDYALDLARFLSDQVKLYGDAPHAAAIATAVRILANDLDAIAYAMRLEAYGQKRNPYL